MKTYLKIDEFCKLVHLSRDVVDEMVSKGSLKSKIEDNIIYIEANEESTSLTPSSPTLNQVDFSSKQSALSGESFAEKTIGTILNLHEKVLDAKDETLEILRNENKFLRDALTSMQELYDEDRRTLETLTTQLKISQEEVEFLKRKYRLMWNKAVDNFKE